MDNNAIAQRPPHRRLFLAVSLIIGIPVMLLVFYFILTNRTPGYELQRRLVGEVSQIDKQVIARFIERTSINGNYLPFSIQRCGAGVYWIRPLGLLDSGGNFINKRGEAVTEDHGFEAYITSPMEVWYQLQSCTPDLLPLIKQVGQAASV